MQSLLSDWLTLLVSEISLRSLPLCISTPFKGSTLRHWGPLSCLPLLPTTPMNFPLLFADLYLKPICSNMFLARRRWLIFIVGELLGKYAHRENTKLIPPLFKILIYCSSRISLHEHLYWYDCWDFSTSSSSSYQDQTLSSVRSVPVQRQWSKIHY